MADLLPIKLVDSGGGSGELREFAVSDTLPASLMPSKLGVSANAVSATKLQTARSINGVPFDGTANITVADATKQPLDATLTALAGLPTGADKLPYSTGTDAFAQADFPAYARTLISAANAAAARSTLELGGPLLNSPYCTYGGTANAITLTVNDSLGKPLAYVAGAQYRFRATAVNTGPATVSVEGLGSKSLVTVTGVALPAGYIRTGVDTTITYDAAGDRFVAGREIEGSVSAAGAYVRLADGTQLCSREIYNFGALSAGASASFTWSFPAMFSSASGLSLKAFEVDGPSATFSSSFSTSSGTFTFYSIGTLSNARATFFAIGRWY
ncbi:hypothetical protein AX279_19810 [Pseudomonas sp. J237]|nr:MULTISPECIES: hypothetical protein [Pseudomonas]OEO24078.1 hypothetical protein AX279_19810 [Pseudomonas sp. J237]